MPDVFVSPDDRAQVATTRNLFSSFNLYPNDIDFETKGKDEKIILMLRQHPITNIKWIVITLLLLTGPTILSLLGVFSSLPVGFPLVITLSWYLVTSAYAIEGFLGWYFDVYFITDTRIVDIVFYNFINKKASDAEVIKIQNVSYTSNGFLGAMFNFGNVFIQTAAEVPEFKFRSVPNPEKVAKILDDFMAKEK
jgi:uncharacterized membrane protein YdbT with pleckstrin-like domain